MKDLGYFLLMMLSTAFFGYECYRFGHISGKIEAAREIKGVLDKQVKKVTKKQGAK